MSDRPSAQPVPRRVELPLTREQALSLRAGEAVRLWGEMLTARDAAHARLVETLERGEALPVALEGAVLYYCGPTPGEPPRALGAAGPTTSSRMDRLAPRLYAAGVRATLGKGQRAPQVREACRQQGAVYLVAVGGAGALLGSKVTAAEVVAYADLGPEAIRRVVVEDFPAWVAYDAHGGSIFAEDAPLDAAPER